MNAVLRLYWDLRSLAEKNGDEIYKLFPRECHKDWAAFFGMAFNNITLTLELLDHYNAIWQNPINLSTSIDEAKEQNAQRVIMTQKQSFISIMSSFEYCAKYVFASSHEKFGSLKGRIY
jgi:hypothetical protein